MFPIPLLVNPPKAALFDICYYPLKQGQSGKCAPRVRLTRLLEDTHWRELQWLDGQGIFTVLFQLQVPPAIPNGQNWSEKTSFLDVTEGCMETAIYSRGTNPEAL